MDKEKEKKRFWRSWMTITILATLVILTAILFNSQSPYIPSFQDSAHNGTSNTSNANIKSSDSIITVDNDTFFKNDIKVNLEIISENLQCISDAGKAKNFSQIEICGKFLSDNANISLVHASGYTVSSPLQLSLGEYRDAMKYYNSGGTKLEFGARNRNLVQMGDGIGDIQNGTVRINMVAHILYGNVASSPSAIVHPTVGVSV